MAYASGSKTFSIKTPTRKRTIKQLARRSYRSFSTSVVNSKLYTRNIVRQMAQTIKGEIKSITSEKEGSIIKGEICALQQFQWESILLHFQRCMPTLMLLLKMLIPDSRKTPLLCTIASQILKCHKRKMSLLQQAISLLLYGSGTKKQVIKCVVHILVL